MKTRVLQFLLVSFMTLFILLNANAQFKEFHLIKFESSVREDVALALHFFENKDAVIRFREVELNDNINSLFSVEAEDLIVLNLFSDIEYMAEVHRVEEIMEDNVTITAKLFTFDYAYVVIATSDGRSLVTIRIPEQDKIYQIIGDPVTYNHYLVELDPASLTTDGDLPSPKPHDPTPQEIEEQKRIQNELQIRSTGPWDPATIDVMIVYTQAARTWGNSNGGIKNLIATAIADGNVICSNSNTLANFRLVHNAEVDYTESPSLRVDLRRLTTSPTFQPWGSTWTLGGVSYDMLDFMDEVHTWRDTYGADLVQLFTATGSGIAWVLSDLAGSPNWGFSISNVSRLHDYTPTHEKGHNMGLHHHKEQNVEPGPTNWGTSWSANTWSAGWRWQGSDDEWYNSVMSYANAIRFPSNPVTSTPVPYFSNPSINHLGAPTGHAEDGNNARTLRTSKHVVAAYRSTESTSCIACPGYNWHINPVNTWQTTSSSVNIFYGCKIHRFTAIAGRTYIFKTGCGNGATSNFNTTIQILNSNCEMVAYDNNSCESNRSRVEWVANYDGYAYVRIRGSGLWDGGNYTLAYQRPHGCNSNSQFPWATLDAESQWKYQNNIYPGEYSRFNVTEGTTYHWSLCDYHGGNAPYDSQLTLRNAADNSIIAYSDDECSTGLDAFISWTANFTGQVKVVVSKYYCQGESTLTRLAYKSGSLVAPYVNITPSNRNVLSSAGSSTFYITSNTSWNLSKNVTWITSLSQTSGTGSATITVNYSANSGPQRVGTLIASAHGIDNVNVTLTQLPGDTWCNSLAQWGGPLTPTSNWQYHTGIWAGEFVTFNVTDGTQYHWSLCPEHGGSASYDSELTLRRADNNAFLAYSNDECGNDARVSWTANFTGLVKLILTKFPCESQATNTKIGYKSGELVNIAVALTPEKRDVLSVSGTTYFYVISNTTWTLSKNADWITSLSPSSGTGNTTIAVTYTHNWGSQRTATITASSGTFTTQSTLSQMPYSQYCNSVSQWGGLLEPENTWKYLHNMWPGEYARFSVESDTQYHWSLCPGHGGNAPYNSRLTLRNAATNTYIAHNSYFCGDDGKISWTADFSGEVKVIVTVEPCDLGSENTRLAYKSGTLANPSLTITPGIRVRGPLGGSVSYDLSSNTNWTLSSNQPWAVLSQTSGIGNATIIVDYESNTGSDRMAIVTGIANYGPTATAYLSQYDHCDIGASYITRTPTENWQYIHCIYAGEYATFPVVEGQSHHWSLCTTHGGNAPYDSELTLRKASDNSFLAYANNNCGPGSEDAMITWDADFTGNVRLQVNKVSCESLFVCTRLGYKIGTLNPPYLSTTPESQPISAYAGSTAFNLLSNITGWTVSESVPWLTVTPENGNGNSTLTVNYNENPLAVPRSGQIIISGLNVTDVFLNVNQEGADPVLSVLPTSRDVDAAAGSITFDVASNTNWTISESVPWLSVIPMSGDFDETLTVNYEENTSLASRSGQITVSAFDVPDVIVTVNQEGVVIPVDVTIPSLTIGPGAYVCYNAANTITVENFTILNGGVVNMVAGNNILMLPGTHAHSGSYLHAWISSVDHCGIISPPGMLAVKDEITIQAEKTVAKPLAERLFKVYPNPTTGIFTIELFETEKIEIITIEVYSMLGESLMRSDLPASSHYHIDLSHKQRGIYLIRVSNGNMLGFDKIIKQ